jgi:hypothetical protein
MLRLELASKEILLNQLVWRRSRWNSGKFVMVGGTPILGILVITLYLMSALAILLFRETDLASSQWSPTG